MFKKKVKNTYVGKLKGSHGESSAELHGNIDILGSSLAALNNAERLHHVRNQQSVDNETIGQKNEKKQNKLVVNYHPR